MGAVRVVYVVGAARSGSTLVCSLLGELPGHLAVAESRLLWRGTDERRCGCGQPVAECPVWGHALRRAAREGFASPQGVQRLQQGTIRDRHLLARLPPPVSSAARQYARLLGTLHRALVEASGAAVIVDSSKRVAEAALLRHVPGIEPVVVHLVRDPRAVAYSWQRALRRRGGAVRPPRSAARRWMTDNLAAEALLRAYPCDARVRVRYEDLVADPEAVRSAICAARGGLVVDGARRVPPHMVGGNALRFGSGAPAVKADEAWRSELSAVDARAVAAVTRPLLWRYGYPTRL
jgi:hypothetical protein